MVDKKLAARVLALEVLGAVVERRTALEIAFDDAVAGVRLDARDRAFARNLVATTLRRWGQIRAIVANCLERRLPRSAGEAGTILALGISQLLFLDTPAHAAIDTSVALAAARGCGPHKNLVNAVLRRVAREGRALVDGQDAARLNTPDWLWQSWSAAYGESTCRAVGEAHLTEPPLDLSIVTDANAWATRLGADRLPTDTLRLRHAGAVVELPGFNEGAWWVQDAAAALPARLLGDVAGRTVFDLCAAPGGKTAQLAVAGATVIAVDRSENRLLRLRENLARLDLTATTIATDAATWRPETAADAVLLDAPCSATGTIRRHPDVARAKTADDVQRMAALQDRLLNAAISLVRPGGVLIYCTCSLQPEEGPDRVRAFLAGGAPFAKVPVDPGEVGGWAEIVTPEGDVRTLPCHRSAEGGMDGFFIARLRRA